MLKATCANALKKRYALGNTLKARAIDTIVTFVKKQDNLLHTYID